MKKKLRLVVILLFLTASLLGCGKSSTSLPPLNALTSLPDNSVKEIVTGYSRDTLLTGWGTPERSMQGNLGDVWLMENGRELQILYDEYGKVFVVRFSN